MNYTAFQKIGLLPYQSAFAANNARFKIGLWARQTGKDHTAAAEAVLDCFHHRGATWIILAASERQALESLAKAKEWAQIIKLKIDEYNEAPANLPYSVARTASTEIKWSNGSRLIALPANPSTIRGYSANLILTEFAFHENPDSIWRSIYPAISNPLRGGVKKLRIISTPNGLNNKFAHLWLNAPTLGRDDFHGVPNINSLAPHRGEDTGEESRSAEGLPSLASLASVQNPIGYFKSKITIHDAINAGLPLDIAELQAGLSDPEAWSQEYLCEFMDNSTVLLPYDLIETCESSVASELSTPQALSASALPNGSRPQLFAGIDFARKNHLTVCWILERLPNLGSAGVQPAVAGVSPATIQPIPQYLTREVLCLRNLSTPEQLDILRPRLKLCRKVCLDFTGPGVGLGDFLHRELGSHCVELCPFTSPFKAELFPRLAAAFESRQVLIPIARDIREDLHSIYRTTSHSGQILYRAQSTLDGHADRTIALALALRAVQTAPVSEGAATSVGRKYPMYGGGTFSRRSARAPYSPHERTLAIIY